jgi:flagellar biosynthesis protein FliR
MQVLKPFAFQVLNGAGDLLDLKTALSPESMPDWDHMTDDEILTQVLSFLKYC